MIPADEILAERYREQHFGDCLKVMPLLPGNFFNFIIADMPYGCTCNKWDSQIDLHDLWIQINRVKKPAAPVILFGSGMFSAQLMLSNPKAYRYSLIWEKANASGFLNAKKMPLRAHEDILVFYDQLPTYNPQKTTGHARKVSTKAHRRNTKESDNYGSYKEAMPGYDSTERYPPERVALSS